VNGKLIAHKFIFKSRTSLIQFKCKSLGGGKKSRIKAQQSQNTKNVKSIENVKSVTSKSSIVKQQNIEPFPGIYYLKYTGLVKMNTFDNNYCRRMRYFGKQSGRTRKLYYLIDEKCIGNAEVWNEETECCNNLMSEILSKI
jgi:hypothetical protein